MGTELYDVMSLETKVGCVNKGDWTRLDLPHFSGKPKDDSSLEYFSTEEGEK